MDNLEIFDGVGTKLKSIAVENLSGILSKCLQTLNQKFDQIQDSIIDNKKNTLLLSQIRFVFKESPKKLNANWFKETQLIDGIQKDIDNLIINRSRFDFLPSNDKTPVIFIVNHAYNYSAIPYKAFFSSCDEGIFPQYILVEVKHINDFINSGKPFVSPILLKALGRIFK